MKVRQKDDGGKPKNGDYNTAYGKAMDAKKKVEQQNSPSMPTYSYSAVGDDDGMHRFINYRNQPLSKSRRDLEKANMGLYGINENLSPQTNFEMAKRGISPNAPTGNKTVDNIYSKAVSKLRDADPKADEKWAKWYGKYFKGQGRKHE